MLFEVLDEITDVTRVSEMVQKRRLIYGMTLFCYRKVFGHYRECTGSDEWVPEVHREGAPTRGKPKGPRGGAPALSGLVGQPKRSYAPRKENERKSKKREVGRKRRTPLSNPNWTRIGVGLLLSLGRRTLEGLALKASLLPLPPIYSGDLELI